MFLAMSPSWNDYHTAPAVETGTDPDASPARRMAGLVAEELD